MWGKVNSSESERPDIWLGDLVSNKLVGIQALCRWHTTDSRGLALIMHQIPAALNSFAVKHGFIKGLERGSNQSINYFVAWKSERFNVAYSVSSGAPSVDVSSIESPHDWLGVSTVKDYIDGADPENAMHVLSIDEQVQYLSAHAEEIADALTAEHSEKLREFALRVAKAAVENLRRRPPHEDGPR